MPLAHSRHLVVVREDGESCSQTVLSFHYELLSSIRYPLFRLSPVHPLHFPLHVCFGDLVEGQTPFQFHLVILSLYGVLISVDWLVRNAVYRALRRLLFSEGELSKC